MFYVLCFYALGVIGPLKLAFAIVIEAIFIIFILYTHFMKNRSEISSEIYAFRAHFARSGA